MAYACPLPPGTQKCWEVQRMTFAELFQKKPQIVIPLFQRSYCWTDPQIAGWWNDLLHASDMYMCGHSVGKAIFKSIDASTGSPSSLYCIDGQQRVTTTMLFLAALRDALVQLHVTSDHSFQKRIVQRLESALYADSLVFVTHHHQHLSRRCFLSVA